MAGDNVQVRPGPKPSDTPNGTSAGDGSGGGKDPVQAAIDREKQYRADAANRYISQANTLKMQMHAWKAMLSKKGFRKALMQKLENVDLRETQKDNKLMQGYDDRYGSLERADSDNLKDVSSKTNANLMNASRERANALSEAALQGAGESDVLRSQGMALRNWNANQSEVGRAFADTRTAINSSLTDLNVDTASGRFSIALEANEAREALWSNYYDLRTEALTQLANTQGQISDYYAMADEMKNNKAWEKKEKKWRGNAKDTYEKIAENTQKAWDDPGVSKRIRKWDGRDDFEGGFNPAQFGAQDLSMQRPSGADLRKWE
jgi:hypothetical protein